MLQLYHSAACLLWFSTLAGPQGSAPAQPQPAAAAAPKSGREFFASWGYNGDNYADSDMRFSQPSLKSDFTLHAVQARDSKAWTDVFGHTVFVPQYNIRFGMFISDKWGFEVALDHLKWIVNQGQDVHATGTISGSTVAGQMTLTPDVLAYKLNNGANPIFFNAVRRGRLAGERGKTGYLSFLVKAGGGFAVPHTENILFGQPNEPGFQPFHGWNLDAAAAVRVHVYKPVYVEFEDKLLYARYFGVNVNQGTASHSVKANEFSFHFGVAFVRRSS